jgi:hypothetical protein
MFDVSEFINPDNEILKHRVAQKLARVRPQGYTMVNKPSSEDYMMAEAVLAELAGIIAVSRDE